MGTLLLSVDRTRGHIPDTSTVQASTATFRDDCRPNRPGERRECVDRRDPCKANTIVVCAGESDPSPLRRDEGRSREAPRRSISDQDGRAVCVGAPRCWCGARRNVAERSRSPTARGLGSAAVCSDRAARCSARAASKSGSNANETITALVGVAARRRPRTCTPRSQSAR
jgi:hypothetical protein